MLLHCKEIALTQVVLFQAFRSLDHSLGEPLEPLRGYYSSDRVARLEQVQHLFRPAADGVVPERRTRYNSARRHSFGPLIFFCRTLHALHLLPGYLPNPVAAYVFVTIRDFQALLDPEATPCQPSIEFLVQLRVDLSTAFDHFHRFDSPLTVSKIITKVENYGQPLFLEHFSIEEILARMDRRYRRAA